MELDCILLCVDVWDGIRSICSRIDYLRNHSHQRSLFGKIKTPEELAKEWKRKLKQESRACDREVRRIEREEAKVKRQLKQAAKHGDKYEIQTYARELVQSRKAKNRLHTAKANLNSIQLKIGQQMSEYKVLGAMKKSSAVMKMMNDVMSVPEMQKTMRDMAKEMEKAGMIEELAEDTMQDAFEVDSDEEDEVIEDVLRDVLGKELDKMNIGKEDLAVREKKPDAEEQEDELSKRLASLKQV